MAPARDEPAAPGAIPPSAWLFGATGALLLGQLIAAAPVVLSRPWLSLLVLPGIALFRSKWRMWGLLAILAGSMFALGYYRHRELLAPDFPSHHLRSAMAEHSELYLEAVLLREPETLPNRTRWHLRTERIWHPAGAEEIAGELLLNVRHVRREWRYGDRVRARLRPSPPKDSGNPGGFNYATYLARRGIYAVAFLESDENIELLERAPDPVRGAVESLRRRIRRYIQERFEPESGALLKALVIGDMGEITRKMRADFTAAGVNHVLSISGLHVAMLGLVVFWLARKLGSLHSYLLLRCNLIKIATLCSFIAVVFYTAIAGAKVPTVRSAIMIGVYELAVMLDREEEILTSLAFAALLIGLVWPGVILDMSFQLSFLAVFSIAWGMRRIFSRSAAVPAAGQLPQERSRLWPRLRGVAMQLAVPLLATIGTGPIIAHYFGHISLAGFISNPIIVPVVGFVVVPLGLGISFASLLWPGAVAPLVAPTEWMLGITALLVDWFARLPFAHIGVPAPNLYEVGVLYLFIASLLWLKRSRHGALALAVTSAMMIADGAYWWRERWARKELRITHLNVGQGDAAVIEFPGAKTLLIDAGGTATGEFDTGEAIVGPFLRSRKILKVDYLLVSHLRIDHYGGMAAVVREFSPGEFWSGPGSARSRRFEELNEALEEAAVKRVTVSSDESCRVIERVSVCFLYPPERSEDVSVVVRLEYGNARFLFAADIGRRDEQLLAQRPAEIASAVLKVPRHGSASASSQPFVAAVQPKLAVVSGAVRGASAGKQEEVMERYRQAGAEVLRTNEDGAIVIVTDGDRLRYEGVKSGRRGRITF